MMNRILPVLFVLAAIAMFFFYIEPQFKGPISTAQKQINSYNSALTAAQAFEKKENQLLAARSAISSDSLSRLQTFLPDDVDNVQLILDLSALAARSNIHLSSFAVSQSSANTIANATNNQTGTAAAISSGSLTDSLDLSVSATGSYNDFMTFLTAAEQSLRLLDVVSLSITRGDTGTYTYNVTFRLYWLH